MARPWEADFSTSFKRRLRKPTAELGNSDQKGGCPDIWQLNNSDITVIGRDLTDVYRSRLPADATISPDEPGCGKP